MRDNWAIVVRLAMMKRSGRVSHMTTTSPDSNWWVLTPAVSANPATRRRNSRMRRWFAEDVTWPTTCTKAGWVENATCATTHAPGKHGITIMPGKPGFRSKVRMQRLPAKPVTAKRQVDRLNQFLQYPAIVLVAMQRTTRTLADSASSARDATSRVIGVV